MRFDRMDLWDFDGVRCVTTNGCLRDDGRAVMGAGVARQARDRHPGLERRLGQLIADRGHRVHVLRSRLVAFPTKRDWRDDASLALIQRSARQLATLADDRAWERVALPMPGCGLGGLNWAQVRPILERHLDDRFTVVRRP